LRWLLEITESDFSALLANKQKDGLNFTLNQDCTLDTGNRAILAMNLLGPFEHWFAAKEIIKNMLHQNEGVIVESFRNDYETIFHSCSSAIDLRKRNTH
jgi:hypothetical protein